MQIKSITQQPDASAWSALVYVRGVLYVANLIAGKLTVKLGPYKHAPRRPRWAEQAVRDWAEKQVAALPVEWMEAHRLMYAEPDPITQYYTDRANSGLAALTAHR